MRSVLPMRLAKGGYLVMSVFFCLVGAGILLAPEMSVRLFGRLLGLGMIAFGAVKIVGYFSRDLYRLAFQYDLAFGGLWIVLGTALLSHPVGTLDILVAFLGIPVLADGLFKIQIALDARPFGILQWWLILALAVLTCGIGAALVICPAAMVRAAAVLLGAALLLDGGLNLSVALCTVKIVAHQRPDVIETESFEIWH